MKIGFYPTYHKSNPYINLVQKSLQENGYELIDMQSILHSRKVASETNAIILNWADNIRDASLLKTIALFIRKIYRIYYFKHYNIKIIHTLHNSIAHDTRYPRLNRYLMRFMCEKADRIAVLCTYSQSILKQYLTEEQIKEKMRVVYHPIYENVYPMVIKEICELPPKNDSMDILFTGNIRPYKNVELVLDVAKRLKDCKCRFVIAGKPYDQEYLNSIMKLSEGLDNVTMIMRFIEEDEIEALYKWADLVFLPLSLKSSLNSGSAMLSITEKKTVAAPNIGTLQDFPENLLYTYFYHEENDHVNAAEKIIRKAYSDWQEDHTALKTRGEKLYDYAEENFSLAKTGERYKAIISELTGKEV